MLNFLGITRHLSTTAGYAKRIGWLLHEDVTQSPFPVTGVSFTGTVKCGHNVDITPDRTEVCKDGSCLIIEQGHLSYSQAQPKTEVEPIVQVIPIKK